MDYGKFKYEEARKKKEARKHQSTVTYKEIKFRPKTDDHDFDFKVKHIRRFLGEGNKARLVVVFRGREIVHPETGQDVLKRVMEATNDIAVIEQNPMMEGRRMLMIIGPKGGVVARAPSAPSAASSASSAQAAPRPAQAPTAAPSPQVSVKPAAPQVQVKAPSPQVSAKAPSPQQIKPPSKV